VSVVDLSSLTEINRIAVTTSALNPNVSRGKVLFFSSRSSQISTQRWMSCASCHFDGELDGRTWIFAGSGPRNTPTIRGSSQTRPLHWSADRCEFQDFEFTIRQLQGGSGLITGTPNPPCTASNTSLSTDLDALAAYCASLAAKPNPIAGNDAAIERGAAVFQRADTGCLTCHKLPYFTDSTLSASPLIRHNVGTGTSPLEQNGSSFDTPSLRMLWNTAPYLHDGSAATLLDVLTTANPNNLHGNTSQLSGAELTDLVAFLMAK
jgi:cytochrome c peroxidase